MNLPPEIKSAENFCADLANKHLKIRPEIASDAEQQQPPAVACSVLLADMQRCLLWMEHVNRCAEREEKMGHWLSNWSDAMNHWDAEYQKARDAFMSANESSSAT